MNILENIIIVLGVVCDNWLCVMFIFIIIVFGIMVLVGILIVIDMVIYLFNDNLFYLGVNIFDIDFVGCGVSGCRNGW